MVRLDAATPPPEVINLSDIQPAAQLLANRFNHAPPSKRKHGGNNKLRLVPLPCGNIVWDVPGLYDVKSYTKIREWEKYGKIVRAITKHLGGKKYVGTPMGKKLLASALVHSPSLSARSAENIIACIIGSFCADSGIPFEPEQVANSCVKRNALTTLLKKNGVETIHELRAGRGCGFVLGLRQRKLPKRYQCFCQVSLLVGQGQETGADTYVGYQCSR